MKAIFLDKKAGVDSLKFGDIPAPLPRAGELLIKVCATAITPTEFTWYPTFNQQTGQPRPFPIVLSHEFSGVIESVGTDVQSFKAGEAVYGLNDWFTNGAMAEYCVTGASMIARKPKTLDHSRAAAVPISALTAWQGIFERTKLQSGQRILIHGAAGGVGIFAVQLAHMHGAHVIATASSGNVDFVKSLGADQVIDFRKTRFEDVLSDIDVVFDAVGGKTLDRSWGVLKPSGTLVTIASENEKNSDQRARDAFMLVRADGDQLARIGELIEANRLRVFVEAVLPLERARESFERASRGGMRGKIVLSVTS